MTARPTTVCSNPLMRCSSTLGCPQPESVSIQILSRSPEAAFTRASRDLAHLGEDDDLNRQVAWQA
jgi:hypothetical protein